MMSPNTYLKPALCNCQQLGHYIQLWVQLGWFWTCELHWMSSKMFQSLSGICRRYELQCDSDTSSPENTVQIILCLRILKLFSAILYSNVVCCIEQQRLQSPHHPPQTLCLYFFNGNDQWSHMCSVAQSWSDQTGCLCAVSLSCSCSLLCVCVCVCVCVHTCCIAAAAGLLLALPVYMEFAFW